MPLPLVKPYVQISRIRLFRMLFALGINPPHTLSNPFLFPLSLHSEVMNELPWIWQHPVLSFAPVPLRTFFATMKASDFLPSISGVFSYFTVAHPLPLPTWVEDLKGSPTFMRELLQACSGLGPRRNHPVLHRPGIVFAFIIEARLPHSRIYDEAENLHVN